MSFQVLLRSDKGPANFSDRSLLKNLGHWLGMQSLACDKPILYEASIIAACPGSYCHHIVFYLL